MHQFEADLFHRGDGISGGAAAAGEQWPDRGVGESLHRAQQRGLGGDMFEEPQLASGSDHPMQLRQSGALVV